MSYTVLARRYRSTSFGQVVGQEPIAKTLTNAIAANRVAHAYLFTGTRGVGKTSMARIFARALNAPDTIEDCPKLEDVDFPAKAVQQRMADAIMRGDDLNVIEIDGASNRGVEEARQLISNASLAPTSNARYKIYIIDEVHMLTREAFNALLKTMEEPPSHIKFILCTTEAHKVPATIGSRCQRFDFRNIATGRIAEHLADVLKREKVKADKQLLWQVARLGNGSMRDALSLLDRLIASAGPNKLTNEILEQMLGLPPAQLVIDLIDAIASGNVAQAIESCASVLDTGISQDQLVDVLIDRLRQLMLIRACGPQSELIELPDDARDAAAKQAEQFDTSGLVYMIALCENLQRNGRISSQPRALLDVTIVRLALAEKMADVTAVLSGSAAAKKKLSPAPAHQAQQARPAAGNNQALPPSRPPSNSASPSNSGSPPSSASPNSASPAADYSSPVAQRHQSQPESPASSAPVANPVDHSAASPASAGAPLMDDSDPQRVWDAALEQIAGKNALAWMHSLHLDSIQGTTARMSVRTGGQRMNKFITEPRRKRLAEMIGNLIGRRLDVLVRTESASERASALADTHQNSAHSPAQNSSQNTADQSAQNPSPSSGSTPSPNDLNLDRNEKLKLAMDLPLVQEVMDAFDATVMHVKSSQENQADEQSPPPNSQPDSPPDSGGENPDPNSKQNTNTDPTDNA